VSHLLVSRTPPREARTYRPALRCQFDRHDGYAASVEITEEAEARLRKAEEALRELGAKMQAFAGTDRAAAFVLRALGTDLRSAGIALIGLSNSIGTYGQQRHDAQQRVAATLGVPQN
jgi:hypothetical protein